MDPNTAQSLLDRYILHYMKRRGFDIAAACFAVEAKVGDDEPPAIDGILDDWWNIFYNTYFSRMQNRLEEHTFPSANVSRNQQTQTLTNHPILNVVIQPSSSVDQSHTSTPRMHLSPPLNVVQDDQNDDLDTNIIIISSSSSHGLQTSSSSSSEDDSLSRLIPRGVPLTHFLDGFPQENESSNPETSLPEKQGTSNVPVKVFRRESRQRQTMGQLRLRPKSNKGGDFAKDDMSIEKDELISEYHPSQDKNVFKGRIKTFKEVETFFTSNDEVLCCHFSSDGKLLATAGNDKMVSVWNVESLCHLGNTPQQSNIITDVRFMPHSTVFATSFDTTIRLWDAANVSKLLVELHGHVDQVISLDFNSHEPEIVCSCDCNGEIRLWDINELACISIYKVDGGVRQVRFQFRNLLAVALGNMILLVDMEIDKKECLEPVSILHISSAPFSTLGHWLFSVAAFLSHAGVVSILEIVLQIIELWDCVKASMMEVLKLDVDGQLGLHLI
ncbi:hypothetical protein L6452_30978 [Arctium lappa]|uniref:Uncharacterized protein n=1 Tax=Arctium lappa TaxID=4217 RepID=A0ACB8ZJJ2_ARCLA|nr:hypothetical protein L6452_30978 [Arctium lappa]